VSLFNAGMPWRGVGANRKIVWHTRFRHRGKKTCVPAKAKTEAECRAIEQKVRLHFDVGVENEERRGSLLTKLAYQYVQSFDLP
jgi:hypothetical protein